MKFHVLNEHGHETLTLEPEKVKSEFDRLISEGYYPANPKTGERFDDVGSIPDTVDELIWGKLERRGEHGF